MDTHKEIVDSLVKEIETDEKNDLLEIFELSEKVRFWSFLNEIPVKDRRLFCRLLDVEDGKGGWEHFLERIGLIRWEQRAFCRKYPGKVGPTETGMEIIIEEGLHDKDLSLYSMLDYLREVGRYDILTAVNWANLLLLHEKLDGIEIINFKPLSNVIKLCEIPCKAVPFEAETKSKGPYVFIYFAAESRSDAMQVSKRLKEKWGFHVLIVQDPVVQAQLLSDPSNTIHKWFLQVDYVIPILSPQLLKQIQNMERGNTALYNRYIFSLTQHQFVFDYGSKNLRCRPFCPSRFKAQVDENPIMGGNGLLKINWDVTDESIDEVSMIMTALLVNP